MNTGVLVVEIKDARHLFWISYEPGKVHYQNKDRNYFSRGGKTKSRMLYFGISGLFCSRTVRRGENPNFL